MARILTNSVGVSARVTRRHLMAER